MGKNLSNRYGQKFLDSAKKFTTDAIKTASKRAIQKITEAYGDLIGNNIADKITSVWKNLIYIIMKQNQMQKELLLRKSTYLRKKDNELLKN